MSIQQSLPNSNVINLINSNSYIVSSQHQHLNNLNEPANFIQMGVINSNSVNMEQTQSGNNNNNNNNNSSSNSLDGGHIFLNLNNLKPPQLHAEQNMKINKTNENSLFDDHQKKHMQQNPPYSTGQRSLENNLNGQSSIVTPQTTAQASQQKTFYSSSPTPSPSLSSTAMASSLGAEITEKMKLLEQIQTQLKTFHTKLTNNTNSTTTTFTQQQIQSMLSQDEQNLLQKLILQRKTVQSEIQLLQQKLLAPSVSASIVATNSSATSNGTMNTSLPLIGTSSLYVPPTNSKPTLLTSSTNGQLNSINNLQQPQSPQLNTVGTKMTKQDLLEQCTQKLNQLRSLKTVITTNSDGQPQQQLILTQIEFDQMKKLMELQSQLQSQIQSEQQLQQQQQQQQSQTLNTITASNNSTSVGTISINTSNGTPIKLNELSLSDKYKLNEIIKGQLQQIQNNNNNNSSPIDQQQNKDKYIMLFKKQAEIQSLINQHEKQLVQGQPQQQQPNSNESNNSLVLNRVITNFNNNTQNLKINAGQTVFQNTTLNQNNNVNPNQFQIITQQQSPQIVNGVSNGNNNLTSSIMNQNKQTPMKIRNVIAAQQQHQQQQQYNQQQIQQQSPQIKTASNIIQINPLLNTSNVTQINSSSPLRTLVINNKDNLLQSPLASNTTNSIPNNHHYINSNNTNIYSTLANPNINIMTSTASPIITNNTTTVPSLLPLSFAINLHKQNFPHVEFKCLNFEELAQNGIITKQTDDLTINLLKQLDERASTVINPDQVESFSRNQVKLVKKYLEQQHSFKQTVRTRIQEQLIKDQKLVIEPDFRTPFQDKTDAIKRLSRYHVLQKTVHEPTDTESKKFDECYEQVSERLLKVADAMKKRFHLFQLRSMQKEVVSQEETLLLKLFVDDLKQSFETEKQSYTNEQQKQKAACNSNFNNINSSFNSVNNNNNNKLTNQSIVFPQNTLKRPLIDEPSQTVSSPQRSIKQLITSCQKESSTSSSSTSTPSFLTMTPGAIKSTSYLPSPSTTASTSASNTSFASNGPSLASASSFSYNNSNNSINNSTSTSTSSNASNNTDQVSSSAYPSSSSYMSSNMVLSLADDRNYSDKSTNSDTKIDTNAFLNTNSHIECKQTSTNNNVNSHNSIPTTVQNSFFNNSNSNNNDETMNNLSCLDDDFILNDDDNDENELINVPNSILDF